MFKKVYLILFVQLFCLFNLKAFIYVEDEASLKKAVESVGAGDVIVLKAGIYRDVDLEIRADATAKKPIIIRSEKASEALITGKSTWDIHGKHIQLEGLTFKELDKGRINIIASEYCRITKCYFLENKTRALISIFKGGHHSRVDHCVFEKNAAISINVIAGKGDELLFPVHARIDHNTFSDVPLKERKNGRETIKVGARPYLNGSTKGYVLVEYNKFTRCDGEPEIISNKISANVFRQNSFEDCVGELVIRGGHDCVVIGNRFKNCAGGVRLSGSGHLVLNNVIEASVGTDLYKDVPNDGTGLRFVYGADVKDPAFYFAVSDCLIAHNSISDCKDVAIELGSLKGRDLVKTSIKGDSGWDVKKYGENKFLHVAPFNNKIVNNRMYARSGSLIRNVDSPDNLLAANVLSLPRKEAIEWAGASETNIVNEEEIPEFTPRSMPPNKPLEIELFDLEAFIGEHPMQVGAFALDSEWENAVIRKWLGTANL